MFTKDTCARRGSELHITGARHVAVARPLRLVGLDRMLTMHPDRAAALTAIQAASRAG